jgi:uncharacterized protein YbjT (DUF2867 family)
MSDKVLVVGATGNVGGGVLGALVGRRVDVRGLARTQEGAGAIRDAGAEAAIGDLGDPGSLAAAFKGIDAAFIVTRGTENQVEMAANAITAAKRAGVKRIVRSSAFVPEPALDTILGRQHAEIDRLVEGCGVPYTIIRPTFFMQNLLGSAPTVASQGVVYLPFGTGRAGIIDVRDIVDVAVEVLVAAGHEGSTYTLTGPASISMDDVAAALSTRLGSPVAYVDVPVSAGVEALAGMGMPRFMAETFGELFVNFASGGADRVTGDVAKVTGHPARSIDDFVRDFAGLFVSPTTAGVLAA